MELEKYSKKVHKYLVEFIESKKDIYDGLSPQVIEKIAKYAVNGKGIRGALVLMMHEHYGGNKEKEAIKVAAAIELFHSGILIADDIIDQDDLRRGMPSIHRQMEEFSPNITNKETDGENFALCVSLITTYIAFELLSGVDPRVVKIISESFAITGFAEIKEIINAGNTKTTREDIIEVYKFKTGRYTITLPCQAGAMLGGASEEDLKIIQEAGDDLGIIFQLKDDSLELTGSEKELGKSIISDIQRNHMTYPRLILDSKVQGQEKICLNKLYGKRVDEVEFNFIKSMHKKHQTQQEIEKIIIEMTEKINSKLVKLKMKDKIISSIIEYNRLRKK